MRYGRLSELWKREQLDGCCWPAWESTGCSLISSVSEIPEIAIRVALGAQSDDVLRLVLSEGLLMAFLGVAIGLAGALALSRLLAILPFGIRAADLVTFACVAILLTAIATTACYIPARRAMRVDPIVALRYE
jgi:putative ABC transport system permease protein